LSLICASVCTHVCVGGSEVVAWVFGAFFGPTGN
jgi:hypothetical protein